MLQTLYGTPDILSQQGIVCPNFVKVKEPCPGGWTATSEKTEEAGMLELLPGGTLPVSLQHPPWAVTSMQSKALLC